MVQSVKRDKKDRVLSIRDLNISFKTNYGVVNAIRGVRLDLFKGETIAIVGESGSGKSVTCKTIMGILDSNGIIDSGEITLFYKDENGNDLPKTIISREYSSERKPGDEPYYPVNDEKNGKLYEEYKKLADAENKVIFGGRLGEYKYYDMDATIASVLNKCESVFG